MGGTTLYDVLGVADDSDQREIRTAYRKLAMVHHPDKGGDKEEFQKIQSAYEVLGDEDSRKRYDFELKCPQFSGFPGAEGAGGFDFGGFPGFGGGFGGGVFDFAGFPGFPGGSFGGGFPGFFSGGGPGGYGGQDDFGDDDEFEEFLRANLNRSSGARPKSSAGGHPSWFFDFDMDDDEYFSRQEEERKRQSEEAARFAEEQREKRRLAKEQFQADKLKRQAEKPQNNHKKNLRKNILKTTDKEAPELVREELEDGLEKLSYEDMQALWAVLSTRGGRSVSECTVDAMRGFGVKLTTPKPKKKNKKAASTDAVEEPPPAAAAGKASKPGARSGAAAPRVASGPANGSAKKVEANPPGSDVPNGTSVSSAGAAKTAAEKASPKAGQSTDETRGRLEEKVLDVQECGR